tara:strand:+ start:414 stop:629 length:216 start_codon:yes stop_codon:yes gene_type:complete
MDCRNVSVKATTKVKLYEGIIDYLPIIILVIGLVVLYVKGKEVRNPTPQVTIDSMSDKTLKQELEEWEPFK